MVNVLFVKKDSIHLEDVKRMWRQNSQTLGYYPIGAFDERARKRQILGAFDDDVLIGYVLYYTDRSSRVRLSHLCVSESHRGHGVSRALILALKEATKSCRGIGLNCRRDFWAWTLWPKLGFHAVKEKIGRSSEGHELTMFWLQYPCKTLFSMEEEIDDEKVTIVLDANVFYDLLDTLRMEADESLGLTADWLQPAIHLYVTPELFNEIQKNTNSSERAARMSSAQRYDRVSASPEEFESAFTCVESICGQGGTERDKADQRQLAWTIAAGVDVFVTRDQRLLDHSDAFYSAYGITIERPAEIISRFEEIRNEHEYQRDRLIGTDIRHSRQSCDADSLAAIFHVNHEKKGDFARTLNRAFAHPDRYSCNVAYAADGSPLCMFLNEPGQQNSCDIHLFRLARKEGSTRLGNTIVRTVLATIVKDAAEKGTEIVQVVDRQLAPVILQALRERQFLQVQNGWVKLCLNEVLPKERVRQRLTELISRIPGGFGQLDQILKEFEEGVERGDTESLLGLESIIWPGKISGVDVPSFIVPILPAWATDLFDGRLAKQRLWGADIDLVLNPDSVYYRAVKPKVLTDQGRILWYVSSGSTPGAKMLRACSQLTGVQIGSPKELFRKYRRFGVYEWRHVVETAKGGQGQLMALEFKDTELFKTPLDWNALQEVLKKHGRLNYTFPSPVQIDEKLFFELYHIGSSLGSLRD